MVAKSSCNEPKTCKVHQMVPRRSFSRRHFVNSLPITNLSTSMWSMQSPLTGAAVFVMIWRFIKNSLIDLHVKNLRVARHRWICALDARRSMHVLSVTTQTARQSPSMMWQWSSDLFSEQTAQILTICFSLWAIISAKFAFNVKKIVPDQLGYIAC